MPTKVSDTVKVAVADLAACGRSQRQIAVQTGTPRRTVRDIVAQIGPEIDELRAIRRDEMLATWQDLYFDTYDAFRRDSAANKLSHGDRQRLAITMAVSTDKIAILSGHPTQIVANVHDVRVSMPDLLHRLNQAARVIEGSARAVSHPSPVEAPGYNTAGLPGSDPPVTLDPDPHP